MVRLFLGLVLSLLPVSSGAREPLPEKFKVDGHVLIYDTEGEDGGDITTDDIDGLKQALAQHSGIRELHLNSSGGSVFAGSEMAWIVMDYGLDTVVDGECVSACVDVFLAGKRRRMTLGSKIGFHQRSWAPDAVHSYYREWRDKEDWATPFEFGSWIYEDTQSEIYEHLRYMLDRGVDAAFAIETMRVEPGDEWYPSRLRLIAGGVLREQVDSD